MDRATRIKVLELDVKHATLEVEATQAHYKVLEELTGAGAIKYSELTEGKLALTRAQATLDKAKLLLDAELQIAAPDGNSDGPTREEFPR